MANTTVEIIDAQAAEKAKQDVRVGEYFVFGKGALSSEENKRFSRLLVKKGAARQPSVLPLLDAPVDAYGLRFTPPEREIDALACIVCDRDLYRAEQDTVHLFIAASSPIENPRLRVTCNDDVLTERAIELDDAMTIEPLSMLLSGRYEAQLLSGEREIGPPARFAVADYTLAPLSGRLLSHQVEREKGRETLRFELAVDSYEQPFDDTLRVVLVDGFAQVDRAMLSPSSPGRFAGKFGLTGQGPYRLELTAKRDAERVAQVVIPGSRKSEREQTRINELGTERYFSLMPDPSALPLRGGFLTSGQHLETPLTVDDIVTSTPTINVERDAEQLVVVSIDLQSSAFDVNEHGAVKAGERLAVKTNGGMTLVVCGAFFDGEPFEAFATFFRPSQLELNIELPESLRPSALATIRVSTDASKRSFATQASPYREAASTSNGKMLICVRDERLTATDPPQVALAASCKRAIEAATREMALGLRDVDSLLPPPMQMYGYDLDAYDGLTVAGSRVLVGVHPALDAYDMGSSGPVRGEVDQPPLQMTERRSGGMQPGAPPPNVTLTGVIPAAAGAFKAAGSARMSSTAETLAKEMVSEPSTPRTEFPELLFYGLVPIVDGASTLELRLGDSLGTFVVEAFTLVDGDWAACKKNMVVDQPLRVDMDMPSAVYRGDDVRATLYATSPSKRLTLNLTRNGEPVALERHDGRAENGELDGPVELSFAVCPGLYRAEVKDAVSKEVDAIEKEVLSPGKVRGLNKELGVLGKGDAITLESADAQTLRVLPSLDEPFDLLVEATANYQHLCCEQTAAKILSAVMMVLTAKRNDRKRAGEKIVLAGIAREKRMIRAGGFALYPDSRGVDSYYGKMAVRYLFRLRDLSDVPGLSPALRRAAKEGLELAETAACAHGMPQKPTHAESMEDAYLALTAGAEEVARRFVRESRPPQECSYNPVARRSYDAYAAAIHLKLGDLAQGLELANKVTRQLDAQGRLYSTVDSVAAIALFIQLRSQRLFDEGAELLVNGQKMSHQAAVALGDQAESVEVLSGHVPVAVVRLVEHDWSALAKTVPVNVSLAPPSKAQTPTRTGAGAHFMQTLRRYVSRPEKSKAIEAGDRLDLTIRLPDGYQSGDLVHVVLPPCTACIEGGGKVRQLSEDFAGRDSLTIPLVVTQKPRGPQHYAVCVRNMFDESRAASPGLLAIG
jgi:hypothetical protein